MTGRVEIERELDDAVALRGGTNRRPHVGDVDSFMHIADDQIENVCWSAIDREKCRFSDGLVESEALKGVEESLSETSIAAPVHDRVVSPV